MRYTIAGKDNEKIEASLHEAVETFVNENASSSLLMADIEQAGRYEGALDVEYSQFAKLYEFVTNLEKRFEHPFKLILITLERKNGDDTLSINLETQCSIWIVPFASAFVMWTLSRSTTANSSW